MNSENLKRPTIGILVSELEGSYQSQLWNGANEVARDADADLIFYATRGKNERVYQWARSTRIDGLIVDSSSFASRRQLAAFVQNLKGSMPIILTSEMVEGFPCVLVDEREAIVELVRHQIRVHGCCRPAIVTGLPDMMESQHRLEIFLKTLQEEGLVVPEKWQIEGDFTTKSGENAIKELFSRNSTAPIPDVVFFSNDDMALGGLNVLTAQGYVVPDDVRITGFDDILWARVVEPGLSTVHQCIAEKAITATRLLLDMIIGRRVPSQTIIPSTAVFRGSCCPYTAGDAIKSISNIGQLVRSGRDYLDRTQGLIQRFSGIIDIEGLADGLKESISHFGMSGMALILPATSDGSMSRIASVAGADLANDTVPGRPFETVQLVPDWLWKRDERRVLVVQSLETPGHDEGGLLVLSGMGTDPSAAPILRDQTSAALRTVSLFRAQFIIRKKLAKAEAAESLLSLLVVETDAKGFILQVSGAVGGDFKPSDIESWTSAATRAWSQDKVLSVESGELVFRVKRVDDHLLWVGVPVRTLMREVLSPRDEIMRRYGLSPREGDVFACLVQGMTPKDVSGELNLGYTTVKGYTASLYEKMGVHSRHDLMKMAKNWQKPS